MKRAKLSIVGQNSAALGVVSEPTSCSAASPSMLQESTDILPSPEFRGCAAVVTLGCAKNHVDSEVILGVLGNFGYQVVKDLNLADVVVVNTCGFLESAVKESIDTVLDVAELRRTARLRKLIVAGCAVSRYGADLEKALPEVDCFLSTDELMDVGKAASGQLSKELGAAARPYFLYDDSSPRVLATPGHFAYIKVAEGCDRPCAFCIIPKIRGSFRARTVESVVSEVRALSARGVREFNLVAQDLTSYADPASGKKLVNLLRELDANLEKHWVRLLYAYPVGVDAELLHTIEECPSITEYFDIPLQHASEAVLKRMLRPVGRYSPRSITEFIRKTAPSIAIRTTFITGFPGETEQDVKELEQFVAEGHFENVGVFTYSAEVGTPAGSMADQIPEELKEERRARIMLAQKEVVRQRLQGRIGAHFEVLVEGAHTDTDLLTVGRTRFQAPEVDGTIIINELAADLENSSAVSGMLAPGTLVDCIVTATAEYDMVARVERVILAA